MTIEDLRKLRGTALLASLMALAGAGALGIGTAHLDGTQRAHDQALRTHTAAQDRLAAARADEIGITEKIEHYSRLTTRGAIGAEQRLVWTQLIHDACTRHRLNVLDYEFSPQRPLDPIIAPADAGPFEVRSSTLRLHAPLLHEGDLLALIDDLARHAPALMRVRECSMARRTNTDPMPETLQADCLLDWITFRPRDDPSSETTSGRAS
jgi:hypothetical protein